MKKMILLLVLCMITCQSFGQKYFTKTGTLNFEASVPAFEPVKASHSTTTAILDIATGKIAVLALVKGFRFKNALMEEHFNENYMDSDTYPKATFNGIIDGFSIDDLDVAKDYTVRGELNIHGKTKKIETTLTLAQVDDRLTLQTSFTAIPADFNIEIPGIVKEKISDKIRVSGNFELVKR